MIKPLCFFVALMAAGSLSAQPFTVWSFNPTVGPNFNSTGNNLGLTATSGELVRLDDAGWGQAFAPFIGLQMPMPSANLADYTFSITLDASASTGGTGFSLVFRDAGFASLGSHQWQWPTVPAGTNTLTQNLGSFVVTGANPLEAHEVPQVAFIEFLIGGFQGPVGKTWQVGEVALTTNVPEPAFYAGVLGLAILGLVLLRRRRA